MRAARNAMMKTFDPGPVHDHWVKFSALLDIWQDEEEPKGLRKFGSTQGLSEQSLSRFLDWLPSGRDARPPRVDNAAEGVGRFFALKRLRVWANLRRDRTCFELANEVASSKDRRSHLQTVKNARDLRRAALNSVFLKCAAALDALPRSPRGRSDYLRALWHTELCASAPDESTIGLVNAFRPPRGVHDVFRCIAVHNRARCHNHLHQQQDAVKVLEEFADGLVKWRIGDALIIRLVGFPALDSMADALMHLLRHVEARWYWMQGLRLAKEAGNVYRQDYFALKLAESWARRADPPRRRDSPRLESLFQDASRKALYDAWLTPDTRPDANEFVRNVDWRLAWHAAEPRQLLNSLSRTMGDLRAIAKTRKRAHDGSQKVPAKLDALLLQDALDTARGWLEGAEEQAMWLSPKRSLSIGPELRAGATVKLVWDPLFNTYRALNEVEKLSGLQPLRGHLKRWRTTLRRRVLDHLKDVKSVVPAVELEEVIETFKVRCPAAPEGGHRNRNRKCPELGCPVCSLFPARAVGARDGDGSRRPPLARLEYVLSTMARSAAGFDRYLGGRTAEIDNGAQRRTPDVEFISLRRWNSFSPNLGSLAADTVGGGYLLRIWTEKGYLGIAIDPGYNFLENLFNEGLTIADLDLVAVTHAHPDHTDSITNLVTLLRESKKRASTPKNTISFAMSAGVLERYQDFLLAEEEYIPEVVMLSWAPAPGNAASKTEVAILASPKPTGFSIDFKKVAGKGERVAYLKAIPAYHIDGTKKDAIGFKITIPRSDLAGKHRRKLVVGVLGDSRYHPCLKRELSGCDVVVLHLGAMLKDDSYRDTAGTFSKTAWRRLSHLHGTTAEDCRSREQKKCAQAQLYELLRENHLYWTGATKLVCDLMPTARATARRPAPLVVLSEFGEELRGGLRADLARRLEGHSKWLGGRTPLGVIPADVGLRIDVAERTVRCVVCERYWSWKEMDAIAVRPADEGLSFVCRDCQKLRGHELGEILGRRRSQARAPQTMKQLPAARLTQSEDQGRGA